MVTNDTFINSLAKLDELRTLNAQKTSSGQKILKGSDDSLLYANVVDANTSLTKYNSILNGFEKTIYKHESIGTIYDNVKQAYDSIASNILALKNNYTHDGDHKNITTKLINLRESIINLVNDKVNGSYLFAGKENSLPVIKDDDFKLNGKVSFEYKDKLKTILVGRGEYSPMGALPEGLLFTKAKTHTMQLGDTFTDVNGDTWEAVSVNVGNPPVATNVLQKQGANTPREMFEQLSVNGADITFDLTKLKTTDQQNNIATLNDAYETPTIKVQNNVFDELNELINIAQGKQTNNDGTQGTDITDVDANTRLGEILELFTNTYLQNANNAKSEFSSRAIQILDFKERIEVKVTHLTELKSKYLDADVAKLALEATQLKIAYQSIYSAISKISELSLVNFLK